MTTLRSDLLRIASDLPKGDETRRRLLAVLRRQGGRDELERVLNDVLRKNLYRYLTSKWKGKLRTDEGGVLPREGWVRMEFPLDVEFYTGLQDDVKDEVGGWYGNIVQELIGDNPAVEREILGAIDVPPDVNRVIFTAGAKPPKIVSLQPHFRGQWLLRVQFPVEVDFV